MNELILRCTKSVYRKTINDAIEDKFEIEEYRSVPGWNRHWRKKGSDVIVDRKDVPILGKQLSLPEKEELLNCDTQEEVDEFIREIERKN